jgi:hypothetical protein
MLFLAHKFFYPEDGGDNMLHRNISSHKTYTSTSLKTAFFRRTAASITISFNYLIVTILIVTCSMV